MACDLDNVLHRNGMMGSVPLLRLFWVLFVILVKTHWFVHGAQDCHPIDQCSCKLSDGRIISLRQIDKGDGKGYPLTDALSRGFEYTYSPCTGLKKSNSECNGALGCQNDGSDFFAIANKPSAVTTAFDDDKQQYQFIYTGTVTKLSYKRITTVNLVCDRSKKVPVLDPVLEQPTGTYAFSLTTICACPDACKFSPKTSTVPSSKLSLGSILCIILLVLLIVYVVGGVAINKYVRHKEGEEVVPNVAFWKDFPFLIKDGAVFSFRKATQRHSSYQGLS